MSMIGYMRSRPNYMFGNDDKVLGELRDLGCDSIHIEGADSSYALECLVSGWDPYDTLVITRMDQLGRNDDEVFRWVDRIKGDCIRFRCGSVGVEKWDAMNTAMIHFTAAVHLYALAQEDIIALRKNGVHVTYHSSTPARTVIL